MIQADSGVSIVSKKKMVFLQWVDSISQEEFQKWSILEMIDLQF